MKKRALPKTAENRLGHSGSYLRINHYTFFAIAVLVGFAVAGYARSGQHTTLRNLLVGSLLFFSLNSLGFWWLAHKYKLAWLYPVIYIWVGIFGVLGPAQVWTLANHVLTMRQAKRVFGVVSSGGILGWIFGGFFTNRFAKAYGTESLLLGVAVFLAICAVLVIVAWRLKQDELVDRIRSDKATSEKGPRHLLASLCLVWSSPYIAAIATVICLSSLVTTVAGWQFQAIAQQVLMEKNALAEPDAASQPRPSIPGRVPQLRGQVCSRECQAVSTKCTMQSLIRASVIQLYITPVFETYADFASRYY